MSLADAVERLVELAAPESTHVSSLDLPEVYRPGRFRVDARVRVEFEAAGERYFVAMSGSQTGFVYGPTEERARSLANSGERSLRGMGRGLMVTPWSEETVSNAEYAPLVDAVTRVPGPVRYEAVQEVDRATPEGSLLLRVLGLVNPLSPDNLARGLALLDEVESGVPFEWAARRAAGVES